MSCRKSHLVPPYGNASKLNDLLGRCRRRRSFLRNECLSPAHTFMHGFLLAPFWSVVAALTGTGLGRSCRAVNRGPVESVIVQPGGYKVMCVCTVGSPVLATPKIWLKGLFEQGGLLEVVLCTDPFPLGSLERSTKTGMLSQFSVAADPVFPIHYTN